VTTKHGPVIAGFENEFSHGEEKTGVRGETKKEIKFRRGE
jgi:hypothetical protein